MVSVTEYTKLPPEERSNARTAAYDEVMRAQQHYASLLAADAGITIREAFPGADRVTFTLRADGDGYTAELVAVHDGAGGRLWHVDDEPDADGGLDDETVAGLLANAADWYEDLFADDRDNPYQREYSIDT